MLTNTLETTPSPSPSNDLASAIDTSWSAALAADVELACGMIAPTWPLDRFIAVNPLWSRVSRPFSVVSAQLAALCGSRFLMPRAWFRERWLAGQLRVEHLREAIAVSDASITEKQLISLLQSQEPTLSPRACVMDVLTTQQERRREMSWREFVIHRTSQFCASFFDDSQAQLAPAQDGGLYASWRRQALGDHSAALLMGLKNYRLIVSSLPQSAHEVIATALSVLNVSSEQREKYLTRLLLNLNGWASWCAYLRWTARLASGQDDQIVELLAILLAWELTLFRAGEPHIKSQWRMEMASWLNSDATAQSSQAHDWILQRAMELAWQSEVCRQLPAGFAATRVQAPKVQAMFCIDVRSEVFRRALETQDASVQTLGFAGFFGLPVEYKPVGAESTRPQLPGLLGAKFRVTDTAVPNELAATRRSRWRSAFAWKQFKQNPLSCFAFVESMGLLFAGDLLRDSFSRGARASADHERSGLSSRENSARKPRITARCDSAPLTLQDRVQLAEGVLRAMSLTSDFARIVLLTGHGSETRNNPHAAGLDCGACCGQTGEVNARAAAALMNDPEVRAGLIERGISLTPSTHFVPGLHNTTTDEVTLFDLDELPPSHRADVVELRQTLSSAGNRARRERSAKLGLSGLTDERLKTEITDRARDWAQVRPEWGLANNAAFIVAPREHSRHIKLDGRSFLHDYRFEDDKEFSVLELIMTAPMVVTHWINLQYYASTVDNTRYGSGNKVLHNVVGSHIGVFEGNGGDLRIGLPMQSLHDGEQWMHTPLRLSVFIEAPREAIEAILQKHDTVRALVDNEWLHLFQLDAASKTVRARRKGSWVLVAGAEQSAQSSANDTIAASA